MNKRMKKECHCPDCIKHPHNSRNSQIHIKHNIIHYTKTTQRPFIVVNKKRKYITQNEACLIMKARNKLCRAIKSKK